MSSTYDLSMPPRLDGESDDEYTDRLTGADGTGRVPYGSHRNRQCSIGYHSECSERWKVAEPRKCQCPCHQVHDEVVAALEVFLDRNEVVRLDVQRTKIAVRVVYG